MFTILLSVGVAIFIVTVVFRRSSTKAARAINANAPPPPWDWKEAGTAMAAAVALLGALNTLTGNLQSQKAMDVTAADSARRAAQKELTDLRAAVHDLAYFDLSAWKGLPLVPADANTGDVRVDDKSFSGPCVRKAGTTTYDATGPARLRCSAGDLRLHLGHATVVLLRPDNSGR